MGSAAFYGDGLLTRDQSFITDGRLATYMLSTYSARKLGMQSTANAGDLQALIKELDRGLLVTSMICQAINMVTGDYSRGVSEITIAGNLKDMFMNLRAVGNDVDRCGNIQTGSLLVDGMMVAGK